jgi:hypothetical protein
MTVVSDHSKNVFRVWKPQEAAQDSLARPPDHFLLVQYPSAHLSCCGCCVRGPWLCSGCKVHGSPTKQNQEILLRINGLYKFSLVGQNYSVRPYKTVPTIQYYFDRSLAVWPQFQLKTFFLFAAIVYKLNIDYRPGIKYCVRFLSFHASHCWALRPS